MKITLLKTNLVPIKKDQLLNGTIRNWKGCDLNKIVNKTRNSVQGRNN